MKNVFIPAFCLLSSLALQAQDSTASLVFSAYAETFWSYDFNQPAGNSRPAFLYSHNRHNEFNLNLGYVKAAYAGDKVRANLALAAGTYMADNYAAEPVAFRNILEAGVGLKLGDKTWLDAGIMPSHIGFESAVSKDCQTLTRGILAENSPYFETGAKITHSPNEHWTLAVLVLNGWQRIARINNSPAFGTQVTYKPGERATLNWSSYVGNERPDTARQWRVFNNFYGIFQISEKMSLILGFDIGAENGSVWYTPNAILRAQLNDKWAIAGRLENYTDRDGIIIAPDFSVSGASVNLDFRATQNALLRFELRYLGSDNAIFPGENELKKSTLYGTTSIAVSF